MFPQIAVSYIDSTSCALQIPNADLATLFQQQSAVLVFDILLFFLKKIVLCFIIHLLHFVAFISLDIYRFETLLRT